MGLPRKREMTELDHQVCDEVLQLRKDMALSASVFARQIGVTTRTIARWEAHDYAPRMSQLVRIKQLRDMQDRLDTRDRDGGAVDFSDLPNPFPQLKHSAAKTLYGPLVAVLLQMLGGEVKVKSADVKICRHRRPIVIFNPQVRQYTVRLGKSHRRTSPHATV